MKINITKIPLIAIILSAALYGCSSPPPEETPPPPAPADGAAAPPRSSALTGTWKLVEEAASPADESRTEPDGTKVVAATYTRGGQSTLEFLGDGTGTLTQYDSQGQVTQTSEVSYAFDDETRFRLIGPEWVTFVPCEVQGSQLTLKSTGQVFTKE